MRIRSLTLANWRSYESATVSFGDGLTAITGDNGQGKTNLLEAVGWLAGLGSFRGVNDADLIRVGSDTAVLRASAVSDDGREQLLEAELARLGRNRTKVNRRALNRPGELIGVMPVTVFSHDDLDLVKGGPSKRRGWIDDATASRHLRYASVRAELERILKQRNALLRSAGGRLDPDAQFTLDVWDERLAATGTEVMQRRLRMLEKLQPELSAAYDAIALRAAQPAADYRCSWTGDFLEALRDVRADDLRRSVTTIGPHRDDVELSIDGASARIHGSQGEQRSLALALRLAVDAVVRAGGAETPILLLDDVFCELDAQRAAALLEYLPAGQRLLTTASVLPPNAVPDRVLRVQDRLIEVLQ